MLYHNLGTIFMEKFDNKKAPFGPQLLNQVP